MKDGRTEKPTAKRRQEARSKGQVARSQDVGSAAGLLGAFAAVVIGAPHLLAQLEGILTRGLAQSGERQLSGSMLAWWLGAFAKAVLPVAVAALAAGLLANVAQVGLKLTPAALQPSLGKLNPVNGLKRVFGPQGLFETGKAVVKLVIVGGAGFLAVWPRLPHLGSLVGIPPGALLSEVGGQVVSIVFRVGALLALIALLDYAWQRRKVTRALMMTKEEVKHEARQTDLAPEVRGALRRKQLQQARKRMLAEVPTADVVVVNPTHYAAALRYDGSKPAPELVAKGVDHIAAAIRAAAEEHGVPLVSNPPLARTLYREVELGAQIPEELFAAVAEVLAYVYRVAGRRVRRRRTA